MISVMVFGFAADVVLLIHLAFILFAGVGALLVIARPRLALIQVPAAVWGAFVELTGRICPLTDLENYFLHKAGLSGYTESFLGHYLSPLIYPTGLTAEVQSLLGAGVILFNALIYGLILYRFRAVRRRP